MSRVLLDENLPLGLSRLLRGHDVEHTTSLGWDGLKNGRLIAAAELAGFQVIVTADKNLRHQQNMAERHFASLFSAPTSGLSFEPVESSSWPPSSSSRREA